MASPETCPLVLSNRQKYNGRLAIAIRYTDQSRNRKIAQKESQSYDCGSVTVRRSATFGILSHDKPFPQVLSSPQ
ncbi:MAG: hypothetical protein LBI05_09230 [Planctomycetaceae bacterium]|nr:hypothetical protein [Planctomycetaceae bacterium]